MKRVFAILVTQRNNMMKIMNDETAAMLKTYKCAVVMDGYDVRRFLTCFVFKERGERDACAKLLRARGVDCICRNDAIVDDEYYNGWG